MENAKEGVENLAGQHTEHTIAHSKDHNIEYHSTMHSKGPMAAQHNTAACYLQQNSHAQPYILRTSCQERKLVKCTITEHPPALSISSYVSPPPPTLPPISTPPYWEASPCSVAARILASWSAALLDVTGALAAACFFAAACRIL
eukprot:m.889124 g.889124  ORF g.889124 m.889124 type:complete len:145 (-) comp23642_c1_seq2:1044-1478(-)